MASRGSIKPHLKQNKLLTDEELERLSCHQTSQSAVEALVKIIKRKGPNHELGFLSALKDSMEFDPHQGHVEVIAALEASLAMTVDREPAVEESKQDIVETDFGNKSSPIEAEPHKKAALRSKVVKANNDIKMKFAKLVLDVYRILSKLQVAVEEIRLGLLYLGCFRDKTGGEHEQCYSVLSPTSELSHVDTVQSLIAYLHQYSSWYNYGLIKFVATEFGKEEGALVIDEYVESLTLYCEKIVACQCPEFSLADGLPPGYDQLVVKVDWDYLSRTAQDIAIFQAELSTLLNLEPEVFILKGVKEGCVQITWAVPQVITSHIVVASIKYHQQLANLNVLSIITAGKYIDVKKPNEDSEEKHIISVCSSPQNTLSRSSTLSDYTDGSCLDTPMNILSGYDITTMTPDELEIISTYSGRSRSSVYSTGSQFSGGTVGLAVAKQFHSCDVLSQPPLHVRARRNSLPTDDVIIKTPSKKKQAKRILKSIIPKILKGRGKVATPTTDIKKKSCDDEGASNFHILDLSKEPTMKMEGKRVYSHYYCDNIAHSQGSVDHPSAESLLHKNGGDITHVPNNGLSDLNSAPSETSDSLEKHCHCANGSSSSQSDVDSTGAGSQSNLPNTASEYDLYLDTTDYASVQRSQSMKYQSSVPQNDVRRNRRLSYHKLIPNANPLRDSSQSSCERVDTPSSGYCGSQSGTGSMQSSLYSLGSVYCNIPLDGASAGSDMPGNAPHYKCSSLKRNCSVTAAGMKGKECKKSARSFSFNDKYTINHD